MTEQTPPEANSPSAAFDWAAARGDKWRDQLAGMEAMLAPIDEPLIGALELDAPYRIADIACGGGGTTLEISRRAPLGSVVHGFDISPSLIESARARTASAERSISFALKDVAREPAAIPPYDRLVSRFGVMFFDHPEAAFTNLVDWLKPGGRFAFAVWGAPADNAWSSIVRDLAAEELDLPTPDPDAPGPYRYAQTDKLLALLESAGFGQLEVRDWRGTLRVGGGLPAGEAAEFALRSFSIGEQIAAAGGEVVERVRQSLTRRFAEQQESDGVRLHARVQIVTGQRTRPR